MSARIFRSLTALKGASTSRVLNLQAITAEKMKDEVDTAAKHDVVLIACHNEAEKKRLGDVLAESELAKAGRLHLVPHVNAPVADLPVRRVIEAHHFVADLTLPYGRVLHDYLK